MASNKIGGTIFVTVNGERLQAKGEFTVNPGIPKKNAVVGKDGAHGFMEEQRAAYVEGSITASADLDVEQFLLVDDATVMVELVDGRTFMLYNAWNASEGDFKTDEAEMDVRFEGRRGTFV